MFGNITGDPKDYEEDVKTIWGEIIMKTVQLQYSGAGKMTRRVAKRNMSQTK